MDKIKLGLDDLNINGKLEMGKNISTELKLDADASVIAAGTALSNTNSLLRDKRDDKNIKDADAIEATGVMHEEETVWDEKMKAAAAKVMEIYPNNPNKWKGYGFALAESTTGSTGVPGKVGGVSASVGDLVRAMDLHWDNLYNAKYVIQICDGDPNNEENWKTAKPGFSTKSSVTLIDLPQGRLIWFRVAGVNASGQGIWSNAVSRTIP